MRFSVLVVIVVSLALATSCSVLGAGENADPDATVTFRNDTEFPLVYLAAPTGQTPEQWFSAGLPRTGAFPPGSEFSVALLAEGPPDVRPICQNLTYYFYRLAQPEMVWEPGKDKTQSLDDLVLVEALENPCWPDDNPRHIVTG